MSAGMKLRRRCVLATVGLFILLTDVQLLNAAAVPGSGTYSDQQQTQTANNAGVTSRIHAEPRLLRPLKNAPPPFSNFLFQNPLTQIVGNVAKGTGDLLNNLNPLNLLLPRQIPSTTATPEITTSAPAGTSHKSTTVAPPAGGHGRGFPALTYNIVNILQKILEIVGALLHLFEHPEPQYLISRFESVQQSLGALIDVFLQRDMDGGIGEIPKDAGELVKSIMTLTESAQNFNPIQLFAAGQSLFRSVNKLRDDFIEPVSTTPTPGGFIGGVFNAIGGFANVIQPPNKPQATNHSSLEEVPGEFGQVLRNTGKLVDTLGKIEESIQSRDPDSNLLQFIGKIKDLAKLSLTNDTLDNENILDVLQQVWFPNTTLTEMIGTFGKILQSTFPDNSIAQVVGMLLQQKILVDLGLNICVRNLDFLRFGNIKHSLIQTFASIESIIIGNDLNRLLAGGTDILDKLAETFEWLLNTVLSISDPLFSNIKQLGHFFKLF